jgi:predicted ATPase
VEFDEAVARAAAARKLGDGAGECQALEEAAHLYQDDLLRGLYDDWLQPKREQYRKQLEQVLIRLAALREVRRDYPAAIRHAERLVAQDPLRETHYQMLIRLHAANNDRASALRAYHQCMRVLRRELGVIPGAATRELFEQALKSDAAADAPAPVPPAGADTSLPMVGRKNEWDQIAECWRRVARGQSLLALIAGEPGIGKTRLAEEVYEFCSQDGGAAARARCYAAHGQLAYAPIAEWLRAKPLRAACSQLPQTQLAELARVLPEILAENPSIARPRSLTESWERHHFYESLNAVFSKTQKPLLLMIDDLQWCDQESLEWMHSLLRSDSARGILVLGTVRQEETGRDHPFTRLLSGLQQSGQAMEFPLSPLNGDETATLATQVASRPLAAADLAELYRATKGNPLFVVESIRAGLGSSEAAAAPPRIHAPRIHAVIAGRLAQLSAAAFELAGLAGTIGQSFSFELLAKATDWDDESLSRALDELWQRRIVEGHGGQSSAQYDFTHDRLREVAYAELSPVRQRFLHRRVARALEEIHASELEAVNGKIAAHYESAGMAEEAIRYYRGAAAVAKQRYADAEAASLLGRALALCREFPESAKRDEQELELLIALGPVVVTTQGYAMPDVGETYALALKLARKVGGKKYIVPVLSGAWLFAIVRGQLETSRDLGQQLLDFAEGEGVTALSMAGHFILGSTLFSMGRFADSAKHLKEALTVNLGRPSPDLALFAGRDVGVFCRSYLSHVLWHLGDVVEAATRLDEALDAAKAAAHPFGMAIALNYAAMLHSFQRNSRAALAWAEEAAALCRKHNFAYYLAMAEIVGGWARAMEGDAVAGLAQLRQGLNALRATGAELRLPFYYGLIAEACARAGHPGEALANISNGFAFQSKNGEVWAGADLHRIHGDLLLQSGNAARAETSYCRGIEAARETGSRMLERRAAERLREARGLLTRMTGGD